MKTKTIIRKLLIKLFMIILSGIGQAQQPIVVKTLNATIYAAEKYEISKQQLYDMIDTTGSVVLSVSEIKKDQESQGITITVSASDKAFMIIDEYLPDLGYVSAKTLKSEDKSAELDTSALSKEIGFLEKQKLLYGSLLESLEKGSAQYVEIWKKISEIEEKIFTKEKLLTNASAGMLRPNKIIISINY